MHHMSVCKSDGSQIVDMSGKASEASLVAHKTMYVDEQDPAKV